MQDKDIANRAKKYIGEYRKRIDKTVEARKAHTYPMIVLFLKDDTYDGEAVFDIEECREMVESLAANFWINHESVSYATVDINGDYGEQLEQVCDKALEDETVDSAAVVSLSVILPSYDNCINNAEDIINRISDYICFDIDSMEICLYSLISAKVRDHAKKLADYYVKLDQLLQPEDNRNTVKSLLFGNVFRKTNTKVPETSIYSSVASNIILINNDEKPMTFNQYIETGHHVLTGYSKADLPMETVYIIGFDVFSDIILGVFKAGKVQAVPDYSFDIRNTLLSKQMAAIQQFSMECTGYVNQLLRRNQLNNGTYPYAVINAEYYEAIDEFVEVNLNRRKINTLNEEGLRAAFVNYLIQYFNQYGLENTKILMEQIKAKEQMMSQGSGMQKPYEAKQYPFSVTDDTAASYIVNDILSYKLQDMVLVAREVVLSYINDVDNNIVYQIEKTMKTMSDATERCKQEAIVMDSEMNTELAKRYESRVIDESNTIHNIIKTEELVFDISNIDEFEQKIFSYFEDHIVNNVLLGNMNSYEQDIQNMTLEQAKDWLNNQIAKADLSMRVTNDQRVTKYIVMTDMTVDEHHTSKVVDVMDERIRGGDFSKLTVKGTSVFRCLSYRTIVAGDDLTIIQNINRMASRNATS